MSTTIEEMISQYVSAWNEKSLEAYGHQFAKCRANDGVYIDPYGKYSGLKALSGFAFKSLEIVPERKFYIFEKPEYHHQFGRYAWKVEIG